MSTGNAEIINVTIKVWRQNGPSDDGHFETYDQAITTDASFLEMLDLLNDSLNEQGTEPIAFESDCREGICGTCGVMINGRAHGPQKATATCQLHMREFQDGDEIVVEPFRAAGFPVIRDLAVDRSPLDRIIEAGGYISVNTGAASDANLTPVPKDAADTAFARTLPHSFSLQQKSDTWLYSRKDRQSVGVALKKWWKSWKSSLVHAQTMENATKRAPKKSVLTLLHS